MTLPDERYYSLIKTRDFLRDLLDPKKTPRVPKEIRRRAGSCLRHYPWDMHIEEIAKRVPKHFEERKEEK